MLSSDFLEPNGAVNPKWLFGVQDVNQFIEGLIDRSTVLTDDIELRATWVYYRIFYKIVGDMNSRPISESLLGDSQSFSKDQIDFFQSEARRYKETYDVGILGADVDSKKYKTTSVPVKVFF